MFLNIQATSAVISIIDTVSRKKIMKNQFCRVPESDFLNQFLITFRYPEGMEKKERESKASAKTMSQDGGGNSKAPDTKVAGGTQATQSLSRSVVDDGKTTTQGGTRADMSKSRKSGGGGGAPTEPGDSKLSKSRSVVGTDSQISEDTYNVPNNEEKGSQGSSQFPEGLDSQEREDYAGRSKRSNSGGKSQKNSNPSKSHVASDESLLSQVIKADKENKSDAKSKTGSQSELESNEAGSKPPTGKSGTKASRRSNYSQNELSANPNSKSIVQTSSSDPDKSGEGDDSADKTLTRHSKPRQSSKSRGSLRNGKRSEASKDPDSTGRFEEPEGTRSDLKTESLSPDLKNSRSISASTTNRGSQTADMSRTRGTDSRITSSAGGTGTTNTTGKSDSQGKSGNTSSSLNPFEEYSGKEENSGEPQDARREAPNKSLKRYLIQFIVILI